MTEREFLEVIIDSCKRPAMFTPTGSFYEIASFLEGYGVDMVKIEGAAYHSVFTPFLKWLVDEFRIEDVIINWTEFRERFSTDAEACENLPKLYSKYLESESQ